MTEVRSQNGFAVPRFAPGQPGRLSGRLDRGSPRPGTQILERFPKNAPLLILESHPRPVRRRGRSPRTSSPFLDAHPLVSGPRRVNQSIERLRVDVRLRRPRAAGAGETHCAYPLPLRLMRGTRLHRAQDANERHRVPAARRSAYPWLHALRRGRCAASRPPCVPERLRAGRDAGHLRGDRRLVWQVHRLPGCCGRGHPRGGALNRPSPGLGGEPTGVGIPRARSVDPDAGRIDTLLHWRRHHLGNRSRGLGHRHRSGLPDHGRSAGTAPWPSASSTADTAKSRPGQTFGAGHPTSPSVAGWPSTTSFPIRPTGTSPLRALLRGPGLGQFMDDGACGSPCVLRRVAPGNADT